MKYSIVIPVFNEEENVHQLHQDIVSTMQQLNEPFEVIFIDDGSSDGTVEKLLTLSPLTVIQLRKNFGQTAAMDAGIKEAQGEIIITLDGDGQNPPSEIPTILKKMEEDKLDVVSGWRKYRKDTFLKKFVSRGAFLLRSFIVRDGIHDSGCSLKAYRRECFENVDLFGEMHRFIPAVLSWSGFSVGEIPVEHKPRIHGSTKYNWRRIVKGFIDMLSVWFWRKFANRPLHLFGGLALLLIGTGSLLFAWLLIRRFFLHVGLADSNLPLLAVFCILLGVNFFVSGILGDIAIRTYYSRDKHFYSIKKVETK